MGQHRDSPGAEDALDGLLRVNVAILDTLQIEVILHCLLLGFGKAHLHHQLRDMGLARIGQGIQRFDLAVGETESEFPVQEVQALLQLFHPQAVSL